MSNDKAAATWHPGAQPALFTLTRPADPQTSHDAAASLGDVRESQRTVHRLLRTYGPATDEQLLAIAGHAGFHISPSGLRTRRHELVALDLVRDTGRRVQMRSGRMAIVWEVTP
jgi:hypothetical protein